MGREFTAKKGDFCLWFGVIRFLRSGWIRIIADDLSGKSNGKVEKFLRVL
jgi:hypothetical protein